MDAHRAPALTGDRRMSDVIGWPAFNCARRATDAGDLINVCCQARGNQGAERRLAAPRNPARDWIPLQIRLEGTIRKPRPKMLPIE